MGTLWCALHRKSLNLRGHFRGHFRVHSRGHFREHFRESEDFSLLVAFLLVTFSWLFRGPLLSRKTVFGPFSLLFRGFFVAPVLGKLYAYSPWNSLLSESVRGSNFAVRVLCALLIINVGSASLGVKKLGVAGLHQKQPGQ